jgi:hypothetical protein
MAEAKCQPISTLTTNFREARRLGRHKTASEAINTALCEYVRKRKGRGIIELFGTIDFDPKYKYKAARWRKRRRGHLVP